MPNPNKQIWFARICNTSTVELLLFSFFAEVAAGSNIKTTEICINSSYSNVVIYMSVPSYFFSKFVCTTQISW